ncbi:hypothetical protein BD309DRAFT_464973 [Dichomitus squalens]|uniref:Uncharacterized protein n=1 Tax=Dichomitus squalens TaxID=114155 RepID=A0A4Q9NF55_9APHY|nr:hypothetical protein BD309DRAFT_464973 [Dichomitus squalens]TBU54214.1 hypothetical protein BD310DRAFT_99988 [Dichomitus squalens]
MLLRGRQGLGYVAVVRFLPKIAGCEKCNEGAPQSSSALCARVFAKGLTDYLEGFYKHRMTLAMLGCEEQVIPSGAGGLGETPAGKSCMKHDRRE